MEVGEQEAENVVDFVLLRERVKRRELEMHIHENRKKMSLKEGGE